MISTFPKGLVPNESIACLGPCCSLSDDLLYLLPSPYSYTRTYLFFCTYMYVQSSGLLYLPNPPTHRLSISIGSPLVLKPYLKYHRTSRFSMVYKYIFVLVVNSNLSILFTYDRVTFFTRWVFWTSPYAQSLPRLHRVISGKPPYFHKYRECQGPEFLYVNFYLDCDLCLIDLRQIYHRLYNYIDRFNLISINRWLIKTMTSFGKNWLCCRSLR